MPRSKAVMIAAAASILLVFASAVLVLNAGLFSASADNVGKLTPAATAPAAPPTVTVYLDPSATAPATPAPAASTDNSLPPNNSHESEPTDNGGHGEQEGHDD